MATTFVFVPTDTPESVLESIRERALALVGGAVHVQRDSIVTGAYIRSDGDGYAVACLQYAVIDIIEGK